MIKITNPADCCGCTACASICNQDAIKMTPDALGFLYPQVDIDKCIDCGLCEKVCSFNDNYDTFLNFHEPIAYAARHKSTEEVMRSRSGAVFVVLSDFVLDNGGVIYGVGFSEHFRVEHKRATTKDECDEFRCSKYVQSDMRNVFRQVKNDIKDGLTVLFSGTPCQTAGLNSYIGKKLREKLILVDVVCHGVPGPNFWTDYLAYLEQKEGSPIISVNFKDKEQFGWSAHCETFLFENGMRKWYPKSFYQPIMFRRSCSNCHFCNTKRPSDITIADFWGWQKLDTEINADNKGVNLVLLNTEKGKDLFESVKGELHVICATPETYMQPNLRMPTKVHSKRMKFEQDYINKGFEYVFNHGYDERPIWRQIASHIYQFLKKLR